MSNAAIHGIVHGLIGVLVAILINPNKIRFANVTPTQSGTGSLFDTVGDWFKTVTFRK